MLQRIRFSSTGIRFCISAWNWMQNQGEAIGIRWDDVDMKKRTININHSLTYYTRSDNSFQV